MVKVELLAGAYAYADPEARFRDLASFFAPFAFLAFDDECGAVCGDIRAHLRRSGRLIGPNDLMIAAIALANGLAVVTHNPNEFSGVPARSTEDWQV